MKKYEPLSEKEIYDWLTTAFERFIAYSTTYEAHIQDLTYSRERAERSILYSQEKAKRSVLRND